MNWHLALLVKKMGHKGGQRQVHIVCSMQKSICQTEVTSITVQAHTLALAVIELRLSEGQVKAHKLSMI